MSNQNKTDKPQWTREFFLTHSKELNKYITTGNYQDEGNYRVVDKTALDAANAEIKGLKETLKVQKQFNQNIHDDIKDRNREITELKKENAELKKRIKQLEAQNESK